MLKGWGQQSASGALQVKGSVKPLLRVIENTGDLGNNQFGCLLENVITKTMKTMEWPSVMKFCMEGK